MIIFGGHAVLCALAQSSRTFPFLRRQRRQKEGGGRFPLLRAPRADYFFLATFFAGLALAALLTLKPIDFEAAILMAAPV